MSRLTTQDRVLLVQLYFENGRSVERTIRKFSSAKGLRRREEAPSRRHILHLVHKFQATGSVLDQPRRGRPQVSTEVLASVSAAVTNAQGRTSVRSIARSTGVPSTTVHSLLHNSLHLYPYRVHCLHRLRQTDKVARKTFCELMLTKLRDSPSLLQNILWTDEAHFHLNGITNTWNCRIWSPYNPHETAEHAEWSPKVTVWLGFTASFILAPYFFEENGEAVTITSARYCQMLQQHAIPLLKNKRAFSRVIYQQDGATPHTAKVTLDMLKASFGEGRVISHGTPLSWPPHSPDLNGCDYWLWGHLKANVYNPQLTTLGELKDRIVAVVETIPKEMLKATVDSLLPRMELCLERGGSHINPEYN